MFDSILLTVDLDEPASWAKALPQALELTRISGGELHVIAVVPDYGMPLVGGFFPADFAAKALAKADAALSALLEAEVPAGASVKRHVAYGVVHERVLEAIDATKADLVVMASHAPDRVREFLVGSQADRIVRRTRASVMVVRS